MATEGSERSAGATVTVREAAALLGCDPDTVRQLVRARHLRVALGSRPRLLARADVERLAAERAVGGAKRPPARSPSDPS